ncbi:MAG: diguanylate cyclase [Deltaproteobacteria bacterium]|nr:diguanylate cyclase [Deltaproteobacteria bacterium]
MPEKKKTHSDFGKGLRLLIVEDEPILARLLRKVLELDGFETDSALTLAEATSLFDKSQYDVVLVDRLLPDGTGLTLAELFHDSPADAAVVLITGHPSLESAIEAMQLHVVDYILKPINPDDLRLRLRRVVNHLQQLRRNRVLEEELVRAGKTVEMLQDMAVRDPLTGLYNHAFFQDRLAREVSRSQRGQHSIGLVFIDLDRFKQVNDSLGHMVGDTVLRTVASILQGSANGSGFHLRDHDFAARYGGDEFVLILPETSRSGATVTAERLRIAVQMHPWGDRIPLVTLSIGTAAFPADGQSRDELIRAADAALYAAKRSGRNRVVAYCSEIGDSAQQQSWLDSFDAQRVLSLEQIMLSRSFRFAYQPIVAHPDRIIGYEAFCRPVAELFASPLDLIDTAERTGRIHELGRILRQMAVESYGELPEDCLLFVNLHPLEIYDPQLLEVSPAMEPLLGRLVLEVNKSREIVDHGRFRQAIDRLRARGFRIGLDDLCPGYLGLESLSRLDPQFVKVDMALLRKTRSDNRLRRIFQHLVEHCHAESIQTIVDRIEDADDSALARDFEFQYLQGFHFGKA